MGNPASPLSAAVSSMPSSCARTSTVKIESEAKMAYKPQFSASSSWILDLLRNDDQAVGSSAPPASGSVASSEAGADNYVTRYSQFLDTTLAMPRPSRQHPLTRASGAAMRQVHSRPPSLKRKRSVDLEETDFTQSTISFLAPPPAKLSPAGRPPPRPGELSKTGSTHLCCVCGRGQSPSGENALVSCSDCRQLSHLQCTSATADSVDETGYLCLDCMALMRWKKQTGAGNNDADVEYRQLIDKIRKRRLLKLPAGVIAAKPELSGFLARHSSDSERIEYFSGKTRADLLDLLSLCDQLKPQLLVDVLVSVSKKHPNLPLFDHPEWMANFPSRSSLPKPNAASQSPRVLSQPRHGLAVLAAKEPRKPRSRPKPAKPIAVAATDMAGHEGAVESRADGGVEKSLPSTWPSAGQGLYTKLPPEVEYGEFLEDDNDEEAFSHFMVDKVGRQMLVSACG